MTRTAIVKSITLTSFCILIAGFLLYRAGKFDKYIYHDRAFAPDSSHLKIERPIDSAATKEPTLLPSSKSIGVVPTGEQTLYIDTAELRLMSGSKSGSVLTPEQTDTLIKQLKKEQKEQ